MRKIIEANRLCLNGIKAHLARIIRPSVTPRPPSLLHELLEAGTLGRDEAAEDRMSDLWGAQRREEDQTAPGGAAEQQITGATTGRQPSSRDGGSTLRDAFAWPVAAVATVCQMLLGVGLGLALILKAYMLIFTDQVCTADAQTLGNLLRCTPTLVLLAQLVLFMAALRLAVLLFSNATLRLIEPLALGLAGALLLIVSASTAPDQATPQWQTALLILALTMSAAGAFIGVHLLRRDRH